MNCQVKDTIFSILYEQEKQQKRFLDLSMGNMTSFQFHKLRLIWLVADGHKILVIKILYYVKVIPTIPLFTYSF